MSCNYHNNLIKYIIIPTIQIKGKRQRKLEKVQTGNGKYACRPSQPRAPAHCYYWWGTIKEYIGGDREAWKHII